MSASPVLELHQVRARRGSFELGPVDLRVHAGEAVAIAGPNGAGKSTLLSVVAGEIALEAGRALIGGHAPRDLSRRDVATRLALLRQRAVPAFAVNALDLVLHGRWARLSGLGFPRERDRTVALESLRRVDAASLADRDVRTLSGGELQRVLIAKALAHESPLLLLDEPTAGLDLRHRVEVIALVRELAREGGRAVVACTHDLDLAAPCDQVLLLRQGRVVATGAPEAVLAPGPLRETFEHEVWVDCHPDTGRPRVTPRIVS